MRALTLLSSSLPPDRHQRQGGRRDPKKAPQRQYREKPEAVVARKEGGRTERYETAGKDTRKSISLPADNTNVNGVTSVNLNDSDALTAGPLVILEIHPQNHRLFPATAAFARNYEMWRPSHIKFECTPLASTYSSGAYALALVTPQDTQSLSFVFPTWTAILNIGTVLVRTIFTRAAYELKREVLTRLATWLMDSSEGNLQTTPGTLMVSRSPDSSAPQGDGTVVPPMPLCSVKYAFRFSGFRPVTDDDTRVPRLVWAAASTCGVALDSNFNYAGIITVQDKTYLTVNPGPASSIAAPIQTLTLSGLHRGPVILVMTLTPLS